MWQHVIARISSAGKIMVNILHYFGRNQTSISQGSLSGNFQVNNLWVMSFDKAHKLGITLGLMKNHNFFIEREFHRFPEFVSWASLFIFSLCVNIQLSHWTFTEVIHSCGQIVFFSVFLFLFTSWLESDTFKIQRCILCNIMHILSWPRQEPLYPPFTDPWDAPSLIKSNFTGVSDGGRKIRRWWWDR